MDEVVTAGVVVVGAGAAGMTAALGAGRPAVLLTKSFLDGGGASWWAQGGIAVAAGGDDTPELHAADTRAVAGGLAVEAAVDVLTHEAGARLHDLIRLGAAFASTPAGSLQLGREAGHSRSRIVHAADRTGAEIMRALAAAVRRSATVQVHEGVTARRLLVADGRVAGVLGSDADGRLAWYRAGSVVLAAGGLGHLYRNTTNPPGATGDGLIMAARAGARLTDLEFVQFHPTALDVGTDPMPLLTEALRGAGAQLIDDAGNRFLADQHPAAELAPRDVVARAVWRRLASGRRVFLDLSPVEAVAERFPATAATCHRHGLDLGDPLPIAPAAHYHMGGVAVDLHGRTSLPGLYACGEVACTGAHGANRLASNSLLEALVFAARVATSLRAGPAPPPSVPGFNAYSAAASAVTTSSPVAPDEVRDLMWERVGLERDAAGLRTAIRRLRRLAADPDGSEAAWLAQLIAVAALARRESRGAHYRRDHPRPLRRYRRHLAVTASGRAP